MAVWFPTRELWDAQFSVFMETCKHVPFAAVTAWVENRVADRWFEAVVDGNVHVELRCYITIVKFAARARHERSDGSVCAEPRVFLISLL